MRTTTLEKSNDSITGVAGRVSTEELEALKRTTLTTEAVYFSEILVSTSQTHPEKRIL
jgi:hypothetical protein